MRAICILMLLAFSEPVLCSFLRLPHMQEKTVRGDAPLSSSIWDQDTGSLWFFGETSLWLWRVDKSKLSRINHPIIRSRKHVAHNSRFTWIANQNSIQKIDRHNTLIEEVYSNPRLSIQGLHLQGEMLVVTSSKKAILFDQENNLLSKIEINNKLDSSYYHGTKIWTYDDGLLMTEKGIGTKRILSCLGESRSPQFLEKSVMIYCKDRLYRFSLEGRLIQVIPNKTQVDLLSWDITPNSHSYVFANKVVEIFDINKKTSNRYQLSHSFKSFQFSGSIIAGITEQFPVVETIKNLSYSVRSQKNPAM